MGKRQPKQKAGQRIGRNMHNMGQVFIEQVTGVRRRAVANPDEIPVDERVEFEARVRGWSSQTRVSQLQALLGKSDDQLIEALVQMEGAGSTIHTAEFLESWRRRRVWGQGVVVCTNTRRATGAVHWMLRATSCRPVRRGEGKEAG